MKPISSWSIFSSRNYSITNILIISHWLVNIKCKKLYFVYDHNQILLYVLNHYISFDQKSKNHLKIIPRSKRKRYTLPFHHVISFYVYRWDETVCNALIKQRNPLRHWVSHFAAIYLPFHQERHCYNIEYEYSYLLSVKIIDFVGRYFNDLFSYFDSVTSYDLMYISTWNRVKMDESTKDSNA